VTEVAVAAERAGVGTLWLSSAPTGAIDAAPTAGAVAVVTDTIGIGIADRPSHGRHPSVLARDVTTIDLLSGGRAAVAVLEEGASIDDLERVMEASGLLHRLLTEQDVTVAGRFYEVGELTTRPRPVRPEGPPVLAGIVGPRDGDGHPEAFIAAGVDAFVTGGTPDDVARSRSRLDARPQGCRTLLWRGGVAGEPDPVAALVSRLDAGADGVIVVLPSSSVLGSRLAHDSVDGALSLLAGIASRLTG